MCVRWQGDRVSKKSTTAVKYHDVGLVLLTWASGPSFPFGGTRPGNSREQRLPPLDPPWPGVEGPP